ncbi:MAG: hypothetical protein OHK0046_01200 [Anaerolineae bacterium]
MRSLHPVGTREKFVASGIYKHFEQGEATGTLERWSIHELPDGAQIIRVDEDWRERDGSSILVEAWRSPQGKIERFDLHAMGGKADEIKDVRATFTFGDGLLEIGRSVDHAERQYLEMIIPEPYIASPKSLLFSGFEVMDLAAQPESAIISYFPTFVSEDTAFKPVAYRQGITHVADEIILDLTDKAHNARRYTQHPPASNHIWLDRYGVLIKFSSPDGAHSAILSQYARRPD